MKKLMFVLSFISLCPFFLHSQPPQAVNYQSVVRDNTGAIVANQNVGFRLSLHEGAANGTIIYQETHSKTTNQFGLANLEIGNGTPLTGIFANIDWGSGDKFLEVEFDPSGGNTFVSMGTSQLISVPYALYANYSAHDLTNTLDEAYDEGGPGSGSSISADAGSVTLTVPPPATHPAIKTFNTNPADAFPSIRAETWGTGNSLSGLISNAVNPSSAISGTTAGIGSAIEGGISNAINGSPSIFGSTAGIGSAIEGKITLGTNPSPTILGTTAGIGNAIKGSISNATNPSHAVVGLTAGTGDGVYGLSGPALPLGFGNAKIAGVAGESINLNGMAGFSHNNDGVLGGTVMTGTFDDDNDPYTIIGGIHGEPSHDVQSDGDNFAVVGTQSLGYSSTGVLGIGGQKGHGVIGIPGGHEAISTAGIRGITREPNQDWPPANFPFQPLVNKEQVAVLGQADKYVAVWGESLDKIGVVGNSGNKLSFTNLPEDHIGVYGTASQADGTGIRGYAANGTGVHGESFSLIPSDAGVSATGNGAAAPGNPNAAALKIKNGAIRVDGELEKRPAGTKEIMGYWSEINSCHADPWHDHIIGYEIIVTITNQLIVPDPNGSIILLTVEGDINQPVFAHVRSKANGSALIKLASVGCTMPNPVKLHYLIINPAPRPA